jgi:hypothetical protein
MLTVSFSAASTKWFSTKRRGTERITADKKHKEIYIKKKVSRQFFYLEISSLLSFPLVKDSSSEVSDSAKVTPRKKGFYLHF